MADERKHEEPLPNLDPTVEVVERESLLDKVSEKPSSPSSLRFTVCSAERGQFTRFSAAENVRLRWLKRFVLGIGDFLVMCRLNQA